MKLTTKILLGSFAAAMAFSGASLAAAPGFYVGGQLGWSNTNPDVRADLGNARTTITAGNTDGKGTAWGLNAGYQFDQNWAAELGYTRFAKTKYTGVNGTLAGSTFTNVSASYNQDVVSIVGKGILPFDNGFGIYGKLGAAYVRFSSLTTNIAQQVPGATFTASNVWRPTAGIGVKYDFNNNVSADLSVTRIFKGGSSMTQNSDTAMVGIAYNFG